MTVLHGGFCEDALLLWAEGESDVLSVAAGLGIKPSKRKAVAWLPAGKSGPVMAAGSMEEAARVAPWPVTAVSAEGNAAIHLLAGCGGKRLLCPGLMVGADLAYWAGALRFAAGLVMQGQFLPGVESGQARWQPMISGAGAARMHELAQAMPPAARAMAAAASKSPPQIPAATVLRQFTAAAVDWLVRAAVTVPRGGGESVHDQWLRALTSARADDLSALAPIVTQWQRPLQAEAKAPFRLSFRLEEPAEGDDSWLVRYLLQGNRDPSLLLAAREVWKSKAGDREYLLGSLGQAAGIYPPIEASLREREPEGCAVDVAGAHRFLRDAAPALERSGFGVMLPSWWTRGRSQARFKARARVKSPKLAGGAGLSLDAIVEFNWELALGDEKISRAELAALARAKAPLVRVRGQWVEVDSAQIQAAIEFLKKRASGTATAGEIVRISLGADGASLPFEVGGVAASGWIAGLLAQLSGDAPFEELPQPEGLRGTLRPYQRRGYSWMEFLKRWGLGACLADDMGLGKTIQALALIEKDHGGPVLLVCPTSVVGNWQKEAARFTPDLPVLVHHGVGRHKGGAFEREAVRHAIVLSSYSLLHRDAEVFSKIAWRGVILDEAQNIKNAETRQARAARALQSGWRVALTGTPVENNVGDLWSIMEFLNPGFLGPQSAFKRQFFVPIQVYGDQGAAERLREITGPFILRRLKTDKSIIGDLPEKLEMKVFCTLTREQASLYAAVVKDAEEALESAEGIGRKGVVLATLSKLKQVCNHPAQFLKDNSAIPGRSGKLARLTEMLEETLEVGDRSLIFTQFAEMGELIQRHLRESFGEEVLFLHGGSTRKQRDRMVERFSEERGPRVFLLSLKAGGTGLNLTRANHVFHFDRWWNPAVENQATDRAFRIGQTRNVQVHKFLCSGTLEERIDEMIERKKEVAGRVVGTGEGWLTELSNKELKNLFALRKEAVGE